MSNDDSYSPEIDAHVEDVILRRIPGLTTDSIIDKFMAVGAKLTGKTPYGYQVPFIRRLIHVILEREAEEVTALWSRQCIGGDEIVLDRAGVAWRMKDSPGAFKTKDEADTYLLEADDGDFVLNNVTLEHVFFDSHNEEKPLSDFKVGDLIQVVTKAPQWPDQEDADPITMIEARALANTAGQWGSSVTGEGFDDGFPVRIFKARREVAMEFIKTLPAFKEHHSKVFRGYCMALVTKLGRPSSSTPCGEDGETISLARITKLEPTGNKMAVYDRTVPEKEWFYCQGFRAHNSGKSESIAFAASALMVLLPVLSQTFKEDDRFSFFDRASSTYRDYSSGFWIGIYAPKKEQAGIIFNRIRAVLQRDEARAVLQELGLNYSVNNGDTFKITNGSFVKCSTASEQASIEGSTLHLAILEESQDISDQKANKSIGPMLASCVEGSTLVTTSSGVKYRIEDVVKAKLPLMVPCVDGRTLTMTDSYISDWVDSGEQECVEIHTCSGRSIVATLDHPLLAVYRGGAPEWMTCADISARRRKSNTSAVRLLLPETVPAAQHPPTPSVNPYEAGKLYALNNVRVRKVPVPSDWSEWCLESIRLFFSGFLNHGQRHISETSKSGSHSPRPHYCINIPAKDRAQALDLIHMLHVLGVHGRVMGASVSISKDFYVRKLCELCRIRHTRVSPEPDERIQDIADVIKNIRSTVKESIPGFYQDTVTSVIPVGKKHVYDIKVPGHHSFVANGIISHNTGGSIVKIGTANSKKSHFYLAIKRNERRFNQGCFQNHFLVHWKEAAKHNSFYAKFVAKEMARLGETSDEFRMNYNAEFLLERGVAIPEALFDKLSVTDGFGSDILPARRNEMNYVAGIDFGKVHDPTVVTVLEVNWQNPRQVVEGFDPKLGSFTIEIFGKHVVDWLQLLGDDYEAQYVEIGHFLKKWRPERMALDYTGVGISLGDRFRANFPGTDIDFVAYSDDSKDALCRQMLADMHTGMITWPAGPECRERKEWKQFKSDMSDLEKTYKNGLLSLHAPAIAGAHDDYGASLSLAIRAANERPFGGEVEESDGVFGTRS